jgi:hypothetical protein
MNDELPDDPGQSDHATIQTMGAPARRIALSLFFAIAAGGSWWFHVSSSKAESRRLTDTAARYIEKGQPDDARQMLIVARNLDPDNTRAKQFIDAIDAQASEEPVPPIPQPEVDINDPATGAPPDEEAVIAKIRHALELAAQNDLLGAEKELRSTAAADAAGRGHAALAVFLIRNRPLSEVSDEVLELLRAVPARPERYGLDAIELALSRAVIPAAELPTWLEVIRTHPAASPSDLLKADSYEASSRPRAKAIVVERAARRLRKAPLEDRAAAARWMAAIGEPAPVAQLISRDEAMSDRDLFSLWLEVMERTEQFDVALDALSKSDIPMSPTLRKLFRTRVLVRSGLNDARGTYGEILADLEGRPGEYAEALAFICLAGDDAFTIKGLTKALADPAAAGIVFRKLVPAARARKDAVRLRRYHEMAAAAPALAGDIQIKSELSYLNLLLGVEEDRDEIAQRCSRFPDAIAPRCTFAMALLKKDRAPQALVQLNSYKPDINSVTLQPSQRLVLVAVLSANNRREEARKAAVGLRDMSLTFQESEFLSAWLKEPVPPTQSPWEIRLRKYGLPGTAIAMALAALWSLIRAWRTFKATDPYQQEYPSEAPSALTIPPQSEGLSIAPAACPPPRLALPGNSFTLWLNPATWPIPKLQLPANGFSLWLDPDTWPQPRLKLPANGFSLWLNPATWPIPKLQLPANGFSLWLDPAKWPRPRLNLPGNGFTLWLNPDKWPQPAPPAPTPAPDPAPTPPISVATNRGFSIWIQSPDTPTARVPISTAPVPAAAPATPRFKLPSRQFTIWTKPDRVESIEMCNPAPDAFSQPAHQQAQQVSLHIQSLPAIAGLTIAAVAGLRFASADAARRTAEASVPKADLAAKEASTNAAMATTSVAALERKLADKDSELTARQTDAANATAELKKLIATAETAAAKAATLAQEKATALAIAEKALATAKQELASRETALQSISTDLTEEVSKVRRSTGEEIAKVRETIATLEQEKAALTKDSSATAAERDILKAEVEKLRREIQSTPKPQGTPEA